MIQPRLTLPGVEMYIGDAKETVLRLAGRYGGKVSMVCTSPPYKGLRRYLPPGHPDADKEIGQEMAIEEYVAALCDLFDAIRDHLLRDDASIWVNLGDSFSGSGGAGGDYNEGGIREGQPKWKPPKSDVPRKSMMMVPERFALEMVRRGWIVRNKPIWWKGKDADECFDDEDGGAPASNGMPISARDRLKGTWEQWYHFVKSNRPIRWVHQRTGQVVTKQPKQEYEDVIGPDGQPELARSGKPKQKPLWVSEDYFYDLDSVREQHSREWDENNIGSNNAHVTGALTGVGMGRKELPNSGLATSRPNPLGRNPGDLWAIPTVPFSLAHFACFNPAVVHIPAKTTCPEAICQKCGTPRQAIYETETIGSARPYHGTNGRHPQREVSAGQMDASDKNGLNKIKGAKPIGYTDCGCNAGWTGGIALDPFFGSGATAQGVFEARPPVTIDGHHCQPLVIGIDLDERNIPIVEARLTGKARQKRKPDLKKHGGGFLEMLAKAEAQDAARAEEAPLENHD